MEPLFVGRAQVSGLESTRSGVLLAKVRCDLVRAFGRCKSHIAALLREGFLASMDVKRPARQPLAIGYHLLPMWHAEW